MFENLDVITGFLLDATVWVALSILILLFMGYKVVKHTSSVKEAKELLDTTEGRGVSKGIIAAIATPLVIALGLLIVKAEAAPVKFFGDTVIFVGLEQTGSTSVFCKAGGVDDKLTSNLGLNQNLLSIRNVNIQAQYTHHSCALNKDVAGYDAVGIKIEWVFK